MNAAAAAVDGEAQAIEGSVDGGFGAAERHGGIVGSVADGESEAGEGCEGHRAADQHP